MTTTSVATVIPNANYAEVTAIYLDLGFEIGDGVPLSANGFDPLSHLGLHSYAFVNFEDTFQNNVTLSNAGGGNVQVTTSVDSKIVNGFSVGAVNAALNSQETWVSGVESPFADSELFDALVTDLGLIIIGSLDE